MIYSKTTSKKENKLMF